MEEEEQEEEEDDEGRRRLAAFRQTRRTTTTTATTKSCRDGSDGFVYLSIRDFLVAGLYIRTYGVQNTSAEID
jgi:hypothetical protein